MNTNNFPQIHATSRGRKGGALISMIAVMLILGIMGVSVIAFTRTSEHSYMSANAGSRAYYLAESGLRYAQQIYCGEDGWLHGRERTLTLQGGEFVHIIRLGNNFWATATVDVGSAKEARARVPMPLSLCGQDPNENPPDEFAVFGDTAINLGTTTLIEGDVAITGDTVDLKGIVDGNIFAGDITTTASSSAVVTGSIVSSGLVDLKTGTVTGDIHSASGISLGSTESSVFGGWLFSNGSIDVGGSAQVHGHIHSCGGDVTLSGSATIGRPTDPVEVRATGDIHLGGSTTIYGDVHAGGTITVGGTIVGNAYAAGNILSSGSVSGTAVELSPTYVKDPICPDLGDLEDLELPATTEFTAGGTDVTVPAGSAGSTTHHLVVPGTYGDLSSPNNQSGNTNVYLAAGAADHGVYYFDSVTFGRDTALYLNLSGTYDIRVFVVGDIAIGREIEVFVSTDGTTYTAITDPGIDPEIAARVYWESHGNFDLGQTSNWFGTVYTTVGSLSVGSGSYLIGSYYSGGGHTITASTVVHVAPNYVAPE